MNIGNTGEQLSKIDQEIANLENIFTNINDNFNATILQSNMKTTAEQRYHKVKWNCRLKTSAQNGLNTEIGDHAKEVQIQ